MKDPAGTLARLFSGLFVIAVAWYVPALWFAATGQPSWPALRAPFPAPSTDPTAAVLMLAGAFAVACAVALVALLSAEWTDEYHVRH